jgi:hypothetical protein
MHFLGLKECTLLALSSNQAGEKVAGHPDYSLSRDFVSIV